MPPLEIWIGKDEAKPAKRGEGKERKETQQRHRGKEKRCSRERKREREERERPKGRREMTESGASVKEEEKTIQNDGINNMGKVRVGFRSHKSNILFAGLPSLNFFFQIN